MNIELYKHLFTPVSKGLPEEEGVYAALFIDAYKKEKVSHIFYDAKSNRWMWQNVTHWLDLSILTTKERAVKLAENTKTELLQLDNPWPLIDVLDKLQDSADKLLHKYNYDGAGHEEVLLCLNRAKEIVKSMEKQDFINQNKDSL